MCEEGSKCQTIVEEEKPVAMKLKLRKADSEKRVTFSSETKPKNNLDESEDESEEECDNCYGHKKHKNKKNETKPTS
ncbi:hypothetical protein B4U79_06420 [Dinothrombium tinctorium]|uniref:Uncharacterized protein n=1 Tax=Dinothrombium tinctorium TaxID=1965070 RepID=A0A443QX81_9ACAR|nr:hypothetical protein B4U79_00884 [Dinothrombium tinctorium]RWS07740.1 hypothetical protein B4U79_06420 [Dinothrombium tinctorium]